MESSEYDGYGSTLRYIGNRSRKEYDFDDLNAQQKTTFGWYLVRLLNLPVDEWTWPWVIIAIDRLHANLTNTPRSAEVGDLLEIFGSLDKRWNR